MFFTTPDREAVVGSLRLILTKLDCSNPVAVNLSPLEDPVLYLYHQMRDLDSNFAIPELEEKLREQERIEENQLLAIERDMGDDGPDEEEPATGRKGKRGKKTPKPFNLEDHCIDKIGLFD